MANQHTREIVHKMPNHDSFNVHVFKESLKHIPDNVIFEMAKDGVICEQEIERLADMMQLNEEQTALMLHYKSLITKVMVRHAQTEKHLQVTRNQCRLHRDEAVRIMNHLLESGMIEKYIEKVTNPKTPGVTPGMRDMQEGRSK